MAELLFVSHSNSDDKGRRVISTDKKISTNYFFSVDELDNDKANKLCGLSDQDVADIKAWLANKVKENLL